MANLLHLFAERVNSTHAIEFLNPLTQQWVAGTLVAGTADTFALDIPNVPTGTYSNLKCRLAGNPGITLTLPGPLTVGTTTPATPAPAPTPDPTPASYSSTQDYTTTAADFATKCGSGTSGAAVTKSATKTASSQAEADRQALAQATADAIAAIVCPVASAPTPTPATYEVNLTNGQTDDPTATLLTTDGTSGATLRYNRPASGVTSGVDMSILLAGSEVALVNTVKYLVDTSTSYFFDYNGHRYQGAFTDGTSTPSLLY